MNIEQIRSILQGYFSPLPEGIEDKVATYLDLIVTWNKRISLTSIRDPEEIVRFHFGESIFALSLGDIGNGRLADVGTGAGFPGLALKLAKPNLSVTLIEPNKRKCAFLHEVIRSLALKEVAVIPENFQLASIAPNSLSSVVSRALGGQSEILQWAKKDLASRGVVMLWVGESEAAALRSSLDWEWDEPKLIPDTQGRFILRTQKSG